MILGRTLYILLFSPIEVFNGRIRIDFADSAEASAHASSQVLIQQLVVAANLHRNWMKIMEF